MQTKKPKTAKKQAGKIWVIITIVLVALLAIYLNRAYARIYETIGNAGLTSPFTSAQYSIPSTSPQAQKLVYVALGDSLTAGVGVSSPGQALPYLVAQKMADADHTVELYPLARPGAKTSDVIAGQLSAAITAQPDLITLLIGTNDIHGNVSTEQFTKNYSEILDTLASQTHARVYCVSIPALGADTLLLPPYQSYFDYRTRQYNDIIKKVAQQRGLTYIDIYMPTRGLFHSAGPLYAVDLLHPSSSGYQILANIIYANLRF